MKKCENCKSKKIKYEEWSPDGAPYYFCAKKCFNEFKKKIRKKGIVYRALPLSKL